VVLHGFEILTLREKHRLQVSENRVMRIFGPMMDDVLGVWRKLHNKELCDLYSSSSITVSQVGEDEHEQGQRRTCTDYWWESQREKTTMKIKT
jgi:hypothetical protein